jgi:hypothetical protein
MNKITRWLCVTLCAALLLSVGLPVLPMTAASTPVHDFLLNGATPRFSGQNTAGFDVAVNPQTGAVSVTNKRIDSSDNAGWPSRAANFTPPITINVNDTPYLFLEVNVNEHGSVLDDDMLPPPDYFVSNPHDIVSPRWNLHILIQGRTGNHTIGPAFNDVGATFAEDVNYSQTVQFDLNTNTWQHGSNHITLRSIADSQGNVTITAMTLVAVVDQYHTVEFNNIYIAAAPKPNDTNNYGPIVRMRQAERLARVAANAANPGSISNTAREINTRRPPDTTVVDYSINITDGETVQGILNLEYTAKDPDGALSVKLNGNELVGGTPIYQKAQLTFEHRGMNDSTTRGSTRLMMIDQDAAVLQTTFADLREGGADANEALVTSTFSLRDDMALDSGNKLTLRLTSGAPGLVYDLGTTVFGNGWDPPNTPPSWSGPPLHNLKDFFVRNFVLTLPNSAASKVNATEVIQYPHSVLGSPVHTVQRANYIWNTQIRLGDGWRGDPVSGFTPVLDMVFDLSGQDMSFLFNGMAYDFDTTQLPNGPHTIELLDNGVVKETVSFTVDNAVVAVNIDNGTTLQGEVPLNFASRVVGELSVKLNGELLDINKGFVKPTLSLQYHSAANHPPTVFVGADTARKITATGSIGGTPTHFTKLSAGDSIIVDETVELDGDLYETLGFGLNANSNEVELLLVCSSPNGPFRLGETVFGALNHNDPTVWNLRLTLPSGKEFTPIVRNRYQAQRGVTVPLAQRSVQFPADYNIINRQPHNNTERLIVGDGYPAGDTSRHPGIGFIFNMTGADWTVLENAAFRLNTRYLPNEEHTLELLIDNDVVETIYFHTDNTDWWLSNPPVMRNVDAETTGSGASVDFRAYSPLGLRMNVDIFAAESLPVVAASRIEDSGKRSFSGGELEDLALINTVVTTNAAKTVPIHEFTVDTEGYTGDVLLSYSGETLRGERVRFSVYHPDNGWEAMVTASGALNAGVTVNAGVYAVDGIIKAKAELVIVDNGADTFAWISDTQHLPRFQSMVDVYRGPTRYSHERYDKDGVPAFDPTGVTGIFNIMMEYVAWRYTRGDFAYMTLTGDIVESNHSERPGGIQWDITDEAFRILDDAGMPYGLVTGNHDVDNNPRPGEDIFRFGFYDDFARVFGAHRFEGQDHYGLHDIPGIPQYDNINSYNLITIGGYDFLFINLGMGHEAHADTIAWVSRLIERYGHRNVVVSLHQYMNQLGICCHRPNPGLYIGRAGIDRFVGLRVWENIIQRHPEIQLVLCGHDRGSVRNYRVRGNNSGPGSGAGTVFNKNTVPTNAPRGYVHEMMFNTQTVDISRLNTSTDSYWRSGHDGFFRKMQVTPTGISFTTYSPWLDRYNAYHADIDEGEVVINWRAPQRVLTTNAFTAVKLSETSKIASIADVQSNFRIIDDLPVPFGHGWFAALTDTNGFTAYTPLINAGYIRGHVLGRQSPSVADASLAFRAILGLASLTTAQDRAARFDNSDELTIGHVLRIFRYALGLTGEL